MFGSNITFVNFKKKIKNQTIKKKLNILIDKKNEILKSLDKNYKNSYSKKILNKYKKSSNFRLIGMGGSTLGAQAIYSFLNHKIKKNFYFIDNLQTHRIKLNKKKITNLIISKSGNTIETIINANIFIKKNNQNIFITENKKNYLYSLA